MTTVGPSYNFSTNVTNGVSPMILALQSAMEFRPIGITVAVWAIVVGSIGNLLTVLTYVANKNLRTTFNKFLVNLALIDFYSAFGMLPNLVAYIQMKWPFPQSPFTARLQAYQYFCCGYSSVVFLVAVTVNRFICVVFPSSYATMYTRTRTIGVLVLCNVLAPIFMSPFLFGTHPDCVKSFNPSGALIGYHPIQFLCTFICLPRNSGWYPYMQFTRVIFQFVPLIGMIILYAIILTSVKKKRKAVSVRLGIKRDSSVGTSDSNLKNLSKRRKSQQEQRRQSEDNRLVSISVAICVAFMITFLPSVIVNLLPNSREIDVKWHMAASTFSWFNSSINPIIYVLLNRRFRKEYWRIIRFAFGAVTGKFIHDSTTTYMEAARSLRSNSTVRNNNSEIETVKQIITTENGENQ